jgi:hypothetical protein
MLRALRSGWFSLTARTYESGGPGALRLPDHGGREMAGAWADGAIAGGHEAWGTPEGPSPEVEDFAAYFDILADEAGLHRAVKIVRAEPGLVGTVIHNAFEVILRALQARGCDPSRTLVRGLAAPAAGPRQ